MNQIFKVKIEEWQAVVFSFIYCFSLLSAYYIIRPIRDQLAVVVGSMQLPWFFAATFAATLFLTPLFSGLVSWWPRRKLIPFIYIFFIGCLILFMCLFKKNYSLKYLGVIFFVWVSVFNLFAVSIFWSFMSDIWDDEQARRLFPVIGLGGTLGAIIGPVITRNFVESLGQAYLLIISAGLLSIAIFCVLFLSRWARRYGKRRDEIGNEAALGGSMIDGLKQILSNPFIRQMSLVMLMNDAVGTIAYVMITEYSGITFHNNPIAQTRFAANIDLYANVLQIILLLTVTRAFLIRYGATLVLPLSAFFVASVCMGAMYMHDPFTLVIGNLPGVAIILIVSRGLSHGMIQPARETLYTLVSRDLRYKGKNAVDTVVWRGGDLLSTISINSLRTMGLTTAGFGVISTLLATASGLIGWHLAKRTENINDKRHL